MIQLPKGYVHLNRGTCDTCKGSPVIESEAGDRSCRLHAETHEERAAWRNADVILPTAITLDQFREHVAQAISGEAVGMTMVKFATTCDHNCTARSEEYREFPHCRECMMDTCPQHTAPGSVREVDRDDEDGNAYVYETVLCLACAEAYPIEISETPVYLIPGGKSHAYVVGAIDTDEQFTDPEEAEAFAQHLSACTGFAIRDLRSL